MSATDRQFVFSHVRTAFSNHLNERRQTSELKSAKRPTNTPVKPHSTDDSVRRDFNPIVTTVCLFRLSMHKHLHQRHLEHLVIFRVLEVNILNAIKLWV